MNGIGQSLGALGRSIGPVIGSLLFAWSEDNGKFKQISFTCLKYLEYGCGPTAPWNWNNKGLNMRQLLPMSECVHLFPCRFGLAFELSFCV